MEQSILKSVKKMLNVDSGYTAFDLDITIHINSAFATLTQLGVGPEDGFGIEDATAVWPTFLGSDLEMNAVKSYVYLRTRLLFDPPATSYLLDAYEKQIKELEWRLNTVREATIWIDPTLLPADELDSVLDGGSP